MRQPLATRLAALEARRRTAFQHYWESLPEQDQRAEIEHRYGPGAWEWLDTYLESLSDAEGDQLLAEGLGPPGPASERLWHAYLSWRETQPWAD